MKEANIEEMVNSFGHQVVEHKGMILRLLLGLFLVGALIIAWSVWWKKKEQSALEAGFKITQLEEKLEKENPAKPLTPKDFEKVSKIYEDTLLEYGSTKGGRILYYRYAGFLARNTKYEEAIPQYKKFLSYFPLKSPYRGLILWNMAFCAEQLNQLEKSREYLLKANHVEDNPQKEFILFSLGRVHEKQGDSTKALEYYDELLRDYAGSPFSARVRERQYALKNEQKKAQISK